MHADTVAELVTIEKLIQQGKVSVSKGITMKGQAVARDKARMRKRSASRGKTSLTVKLNQ